MGWIDVELALTAVAAMLYSTTLSFSVLALVLGDRPLRTGMWSASGLFAARSRSARPPPPCLATRPLNHVLPEPWVAVINIVLAVLLVFFSVRFLRRPRDPKHAQGMVDQMSKIASSPWIAIVAAGATLANPGGFIPIAMKEISETNPSTTGYIVKWAFFSVVSLLPLAVAVILLAVSRDRVAALGRVGLAGPQREVDRGGDHVAACRGAPPQRISGLTHMP